MSTKNDSLLYTDSWEFWENYTGILGFCVASNRIIRKRFCIEMGG